MSEVTVNYTFRIVDREALEDAVGRLLALDTTFDFGDDLSDEDKVELLVTDKDALALSAGRPLGWLDFGLERVQ